MKIDEIAHTNTFGINLETFSNLTVSDIKRTSKLIYSPELVNETTEYYSLYKRVNANYIEYFLCNETEVICVVGASVQNTKSNSYIQIHGVYINPEYKHKGLGLLTYDSIKNAEHMNLMSDFEQTLDGKKLWERLNSVFDIAVLNISTEEKISDDINDAYVWYYSNPTKAKATVLVTEKKLLEGMMVKKINVNRRKNGYSI